MADALEDHEGRPVTNLRFADDIDALAGSEKELKDLVEKIDTTSGNYWMEISTEKNKNDVQQKLSRPHRWNQSQGPSAEHLWELQIPRGNNKWRWILTRNTIKDCPGHKWTNNTKTSMGKQENQNDIQNQASKIIGGINLPLCLRIMEAKYRSGKKNHCNGNEMIQKIAWHLVLTTYN